MNSPAFLLAQVSAPTAESFFDGFSADQRFGLVFFVVGCIVFLALILIMAGASVWSEIKLKQIEADSKRDMLDRGMTADEIQQVIEATPRGGFARWISSWFKKGTSQSGAHQHE